MHPLHSSEHYLFNLYTTSSNNARRIWKNAIKEKWNWKCAYCDSDKNLTLDHVIPRSLGGIDATPNVVACCESCNHDKSHNKWDEWYKKQDFFNIKRYRKILEWITPEKVTNLYSYKKRRNNCT
tara:strand:- start:286 stop:657 length:372 start_codon:yes stop_codon:yes gene_type:complete